MARSRRRRTTTQRAAGLIALALPAPVQRVADTPLGSLLMLVGVPALFVFGWLHVSFVDGFPTFSLDGRKAAELRRATSQQLNELEQQAAQQNFGVVADVLHSIQGPNHTHGQPMYNPLQQPINPSSYLTAQQMQQQLQQQQQLLQRQAYEQSVYQQQQNQGFQQMPYQQPGYPQSPFPQQSYAQTAYQQPQSNPQPPYQNQAQAFQPNLQSNAAYGQYAGQYSGQNYPVPVQPSNLPSTSQRPFGQYTSR
jgi:hypothetical protein